MIVAGLGILVCFAVWVALAFTGVLDSGEYVVVQRATVAPNRVALLAERLGTGWGGNTFFTVVGDHDYTSRELREALYKDRIIFEVGRGNLELSWMTPQNLVVRCVACAINTNEFQQRRTSYEGLSITYSDFPDEGRHTP